MKPTEYRCEVTSNKMITPTVFETCFIPDHPLEFKAGQFVSIIIPGAGPKGRDLRRAYSIASAPHKQPIELCVKLVEEGPGTNYLHQLKVGDTFRAMAPYGDFTYEAKPGRNACFIATGTGIAPFHAMATSEEFKNHAPKKAYCFLGVRTEDEILYPQTFENIPQLQFIPTVSQPSSLWKGFRGRVTDYIFKMEDEMNWLETEYYLCGHGGMINEIKAFLTGKGVAKDSIHQEIYYK